MGNSKIDELGRISLPVELRKRYGWDKKDTLALYFVDQNTLILQLSEKYPGPRCVFCGATESARNVNGKDVCGECLERFKAVD